MRDLRNDAQSLVEYVTPRGPVWGSSIVTQEIAETYKKQRLKALKPGFTIRDWVYTGNNTFTQFHTLRHFHFKTYEELIFKFPELN